MTREEKVKFVISAVWFIMEATVTEDEYKDMSDEQLDELVDWYDYLMGK